MQYVFWDYLGKAFEGCDIVGDLAANYFDKSCHITGVGEEELSTGGTS